MIAPMDIPIDIAACFDAHCHLSFAPEPERFADRVATNTAGAFSTTVSPSDFTRTVELLAPWDTLKAGLGAHPWWVTRGDVRPQDASLLGSLVARTRFIGEVGLDFGKNVLANSVFTTEDETKIAQVAVLRAVLEACAVTDPIQDHPSSASFPECAGRVFSFHAVRSADVILDLLEEFDLLSGNTAIFHWFSGSSAQLQRARELGCCFSVNALMLQTKRGREYAKAIPAGQLLVETDLPEEAEEDFEAARQNYERALTLAYAHLVTFRSSDILGAIRNNVQRIFNV